MSEGIKPTSREEWEQYLRDNLPDGSNKCPKCDEKDAEILRLREENRKLREAVIDERAKRNALEGWYLDEDAYNRLGDAWNWGIPGRQFFWTEAESELRAEGVIE